MITTHQKLKHWWHEKLLIHWIKKYLPQSAKRKFPIPSPLTTKRLFSIVVAFLEKRGTIIIIILTLIGIFVMLYTHYYKQNIRNNYNNETQFR